MQCPIDDLEHWKYIYIYIYMRGETGRRSSALQPLEPLRLQRCYAASVVKLVL